jgi:hypothetical protein
MSRRAHVASIEAIADFRTALIQYRETLLDTLTDLSLQSKRAEVWIQQQQPAYWRDQCRLAVQQVAETRHQLELCELNLQRGERNSCTLEKRAYDRARQRWRKTEEMLNSVRDWQRKLRPQFEEARIQLAKTRYTVEEELLAGVARLDQLLDALTKYIDQSTIRPYDADQPPVEAPAADPSTAAAESRPKVSPIDVSQDDV